jgi:23S rRNA pseudouridine2605 synthase
MQERLQKILAEAGIGSRRKCEELITAGRISVNGRTANVLGTKADPDTDDIAIDGKPIRKSTTKVYLMLNKPKGVITSISDPQGRKVVTDYIHGIEQRIYPVGRLDYDSEGLLLLTNDGEFAQLMTHPSHHVPKTYLATVQGTPHGDILDKLRDGINLDDGVTAPAEIEYYDIDPDKKETVLTITIHEGRNRQIRRMLEAVNYPVRKLKRIQYGPLDLNGLARGKFRHLSAQEVNELKQSAVKSHKFQENRP